MTRKLGVDVGMVCRIPAAHPVEVRFCDIDADTLNLDPVTLESLQLSHAPTVWR